MLTHDPSGTTSVGCFITASEVDESGMTLAGVQGGAEVEAEKAGAERSGATAPLAELTHWQKPDGAVACGRAAGPSPRVADALSATCPACVEVARKLTAKKPAKKKPAKKDAPPAPADDAKATARACVDELAAVAEWARSGLARGWLTDVQHAEILDRAARQFVAVAVELAGDVAAGVFHG